MAWQWWNKFMHTRSQSWIFEALKPEQVPGQPSRDIVKANKAYARIYLKSMRIVNVRTFRTKFYGAVHSHATFLHTAGRPAEFSKLIVPQQLREQDPKRIDRVINIDQLIAGWTPYRGDQVGLEIGLFSIKSEDLTAPFLNLLESVGSLAAVPYVSAALPFLPIMSQGLDLLTGTADESILEVGLSTEFPTLQTGYWLIMRAPKGQVDVDSLRVDASDFSVLDGDGKPVGDYPYMVFQIESSNKREDWFQIPEISVAFQTLKDLVRDGRFDDAREALVIFRRITLTSDDLIQEHAEKIVAMIEKRVKKIIETPVRAAFSVERELPELQEFEIFE